MAKDLKDYTDDELLVEQKRRRDELQKQVEKLEGRLRQKSEQISRLQDGIQKAQQDTTEQA